jgi:DNA-directed RNA polymerase specialized sigma54-like protein
MKHWRESCEVKARTLTMALEVKLGHDLRQRQQLVMTPQLQQAIKILQLSLPELETLVRNESVAETAVITKKSKNSK